MINHPLSSFDHYLYLGELLPGINKDCYYFFIIEQYQNLIIINDLNDYLLIIYTNLLTDLIVPTDQRKRILGQKAVRNK